MSIEKFIDEKGELNVIQQFDLPISSLAYLKYLPGLLLIILSTNFLLAFGVGLLWDIDKNLGKVIKDHLYVVCRGPEPLERGKK